MDAASEVFARRGFRGGSLRDVAERAGVSAANIVHHFGSKEGLLVAVLEARDVRSSVSLEPLLDRGELVQGLRSLVRTNLADRGMVRLFTTLVAEATDPGHPAHEYFCRRYSDVRSSMTAGVEKARAAGALPPGPPAEMVTGNLIAILDGLQTQWLLNPDFDMARAFDAYLSSIGARLDALP